MNNEFNFSDAERVAMARMAHQNEAARIDDEMRRRERVEQDKKVLEQLAADNRERIAEQEQKEREQMFVAQSEIAFFKANPTATEADFKRLLPKIRDEFLLGNFRDVINASKPDGWDSEMN